MKTKTPILFLIVLSVIGCKTLEFSKGKFFQGRAFENERFFVHDAIKKPNELIKIGDSTSKGDLGYGYYSWKTIKTLHLLKNDSTERKREPVQISVYNTITNDSLLKHENDKLAYIQKKKNVHINNLYFIDDHRCIYLSFDDNRANDTWIIPLFFDKKNYKIEKELEKRFEQFLRGYYTVKEDDIFFHFESPYESRFNYFVKGKIKNDSKSIEFLSMTVPSSQNQLYEDGYNANFKEFVNIFHKNAQPIFETVEPIEELTFPPQNYISLGFELISNQNKLNKLHQKLRDKYPELLVNDTLIISKIIYTILDDSTSSRTYHLYKYSDQSRKIYTIDETTAENNKSLIDTW